MLSSDTQVSHFQSLGIRTQNGILPVFENLKFENPIVLDSRLTVVELSTSYSKKVILRSLIDKTKVLSN